MAGLLTGWVTPPSADAGAIDVATSQTGLRFIDNDHVFIKCWTRMLYQAIVLFKVCTLCAYE